MSQILPLEENTYQLSIVASGTVGTSTTTPTEPTTPTTEGN